MQSSFFAKGYRGAADPGSTSARPHHHDRAGAEFKGRAMTRQEVDQNIESASTIPKLSKSMLSHDTSDLHLRLKTLLSMERN